MTRLCFDSVTPASIPQGSEFVAGYVDGLYAWSDQDWMRFPNATKIGIAVFSSTNDGHVLDVEPGDATSVQSVGWVQRRRAAGVDPTVYCGLWQWHEVWQAFEAAGVEQPHYWIAHYDNDPTLPIGATAKQYANPPLTGGHYDASAVADVWPGVEDDMAVSREEFDEYKKEFDEYKKNVFASFEAHVVAIGNLTKRVTTLEANEVADDAAFQGVQKTLDKLRVALA